MILNKLGLWAPSLTEKPDRSFVKRVVQTLFPENTGEEEPSSPSGVPYPDWHDGLEIQPEEFMRAVKRGLRWSPARDTPRNWRVWCGTWPEIMTQSLPGHLPLKHPVGHRTGFSR
ncbi:hypothetical protein KM043_018570 [Ampulex compressa]|nr:hypothetical protein KM043_018570 [Ampulex compressa]